MKSSQRKKAIKIRHIPARLLLHVFPSKKPTEELVEDESGLAHWAHWAHLGPRSVDNRVKKDEYQTMRTTR